MKDNRTIEATWSECTGEFVVVGDRVVDISCPKTKNESSTKASAVDGKAKARRAVFNFLFLKNRIATVAIMRIIDPVSINVRIVGHENEFDLA